MCRKLRGAERRLSNRVCSPVQSKSFRFFVQLHRQKAIIVGPNPAVRRLDSSKTSRLERSSPTKRSVPAASDAFLVCEICEQPEWELINSRWLSEATPPETMNRYVFDPGRGAESAICDPLGSEINGFCPGYAALQQPRLLLEIAIGIKNPRGEKGNQHVVGVVTR